MSEQSPAAPRVVANVGSGPRGGSTLPPHFAGWRELRVDVDPDVAPDIVASLTNLSEIADGSLDAIWAAHCVEHLYAHEVPVALREFHRTLKADGFACVIVPDLQAVASYFVADRPHEPIYTSAAGPVSALDMFYGYGRAIADGHTSMAHRCGFTPALLEKLLRESPFPESVVRRRGPQLELAVIARKTAAPDAAARQSLTAALGL